MGLDGVFIGKATYYKRGSGYFSIKALPFFIKKC